MAGAVDEVTTEIWDKIVNDNSDYIEGMFVATSSGFQKYMAFHNDTLSSPTTPYDRDVVRTTLFETVKALPTDIPFFFDWIECCDLSCVIYISKIIFIGC